MSEWISVQERLPERDEDVLVYFDLKLCVAYWLGEYFNRDVPWVETVSRYHLDHPPTHWMPLPNLPQLPNAQASNPSSEGSSLDSPSSG